VEPAEDPVARGARALASGDWVAARTHFETALAREETVPALEGLSEALYWLEQIRPSLDRRRHAYALSRQSGDATRAARAAIWIARAYFSLYANAAVGNGWLRRAERLLNETGDCPERGWLLQLRGKLIPDADAALEHARAAAAIAGRHGDRDLEVWALSEQGRALVSLGDVEEGMAFLDEAVAAATAGEAKSLLVVGDACCNMLSACDRAADFGRATEWCQVVDEFTERNRCPPIFHYCRVVYSGVLMATGRWREAESELRSALRAVERDYPTEQVHSLSRLAILCVRQGRLEEADQLLAGVSTQGVAAEAASSLHLARGQVPLAEALIERRLDAVGAGLSAAPLLRLLADARLARGEVEGARDAAVRLAEIAERSKRPPIRAMACLAAARVDATAGGDPHARFEEACALFDGTGMIFDSAVSRLEWARALASDRSELAAEEARWAMSAFERLGARPHADQAAALLRELGEGTRPGPRVPGELTRREGEVLDLLSLGLSNPEIGGRLFISPKTVEHHVSRILSKLGLRNRAEAVAWTLRNPISKSDRK
jgi:ATP/maltotriose-dependent transcriptional regulator MalT